MHYASVGPGLRESLQKVTDTHSIRYHLRTGKQCRTLLERKRDAVALVLRLINPRNGDPLRAGVQCLHRLLQDPYRLFDVVVDDGQVKEVAERSLQRVRLFDQAL